MVVLDNFSCLASKINNVRNQANGRLYKIGYIYLAVKKFPLVDFLGFRASELQNKVKNVQFNLISFRGNCLLYSTIAAKFVNSMRGTQRPATNNPRLMMFYCLLHKQRTLGKPRLYPNISHISAIIYCHLLNHIPIPA